MADERTKKWVTAIFMIALFLVVAIYIGLAMLRIYTDSSRFSTEKSKSSVDCVGYVYSIDNARYADGLLSFELKNSDYSDYEEMNLIIKSGNATKEVALTNLIRGLKKSIDIEMPIQDSKFSTYPKSCEDDAQDYTVT